MFKYAKVAEGGTATIYGEIVIEDNQGDSESAEKILRDEVQQINWSSDDPDIAEVTSVETDSVTTTGNRTVLKIKVGITAFHYGKITIKGITTNDIVSLCKIELTSRNVYIPPFTGELNDLVYQMPAESDTIALITIDDKEYKVTNNFNISKAIEIKNTYNCKTVVVNLVNNKVSSIISVLDIVEPDVKLTVDPQTLKYVNKQYESTVLDCTVELTGKVKKEYRESLIEGTEAENVKFDFTDYTLTVRKGLYFDGFFSDSQSQQKKVNKKASINESLSFKHKIAVDTKLIPETVNSSYQVEVKANSNGKELLTVLNVPVQNIDLQKKNEQKKIGSISRAIEAYDKCGVAITENGLIDSGYTYSQIKQIKSAIYTWVCTQMAAKSFAEQDFTTNAWVQMFKGAVDPENIKEYCYEGIDDVFKSLGVNIKPMKSQDKLTNIGIENVTGETKIYVRNSKGKIDSTITVSVNYNSFNIGKASNVGSFGTVNYTVDKTNKTGEGTLYYTNLEAFFPEIEAIAMDEFKDTMEDAIDDITGDFSIFSKSYLIKKQVSSLLVGIYNAQIQNMIMHDDCINYSLKNKGYSISSNAASYRIDGAGHCPVDVYVYNSDGELCGSVINNEVTVNDDSVYLCCVGNEKYFSLIGDRYKIKFVGTDSGTMKYEIREFINDELQREISYDDVNVEQDKELFSNIPIVTGVPAEYYDLYSSNAESISYSSENNIDITIPDIHQGTLGDIDDDQTITANDALIILRASVGLDSITPEQTSLADVDGDSTITSGDAQPIAA